METCTSLKRRVGACAAWLLVIGGSSTRPSTAGGDQGTGLEQHGDGARRELAVNLYDCRSTNAREVVGDVVDAAELHRSVANSSRENSATFCGTDDGNAELSDDSVDSGPHRAM